MDLKTYLKKANPLTVAWVQDDFFCDNEPGAPRTPWGPAQCVIKYDGDNLGEMSTAGHGGFYVRGDWALKIPPYLRKTWYEEDCEINIVAYYLYDELKALQEEFKLQGRRYPYYGILGAFENNTKASMEKSFLRWYRATVDFHTNKETPRAEFERQDEYERYQHDLQALREDAKLQQAKKITAGDVVEFAKPLTFRIDGSDLKVSRFKAVRWGQRAIRFKPLDVNADFMANIPHLKRRTYTVLAA